MTERKKEARQATRFQLFAEVFAALRRSGKYADGELARAAAEMARAETEA
jgi:hypothetical protein